MNQLRRIVAELHRRSVWQVVSVYVIGCWVVYQVVLGLVEGLGRPDDAVADLRAFRQRTRCDICGLVDRARAHEIAGRFDSAIADYRRYLETPEPDRLEADGLAMPFVLEHLGRLYDDLGRPDSAVHFTARFLELWNDVDPELRPRVDAARRRLATLVGEGRE